jgi:hypothetical protein
VDLSHRGRPYQGPPPIISRGGGIYPSTALEVLLENSFQKAGFGDPCIVNPLAVRTSA